MTECEDVADGVQEHALLQNYLPEFAFEPGCLRFPKLLGKAERNRDLSLCISGSKNLVRGAGRCWHHCWGRAGIVLGELCALKVGRDPCNQQVSRRDGQGFNNLKH